LTVHEQQNVLERRDKGKGEIGREKKKEWDWSELPSVLTKKNTNNAERMKQKEGVNKRAGHQTQSAPRHCLKGNVKRGGEGVKGSMVHAQRSADCMIRETHFFFFFSV